MPEVRPKTPRERIITKIRSIRGRLVKGLDPDERARAQAALERAKKQLKEHLL